MSSSNRDPFFSSSSSLGRRALGASPSRLPPFPSSSSSSFGSSSSLRRGVLGGSPFRHLPAPSSSVDHLEALLSGPSPSSPSSSSRASEKAQLQGLNDRFASYIEKVHLLEQQNQQLEAEAGALRGRLLSEPSRLQGLYQQELQELRAALEAMRQDGDRAALEGQRMARDLQRLRQQEALQVQRSQEAQDQLRQARRQADQDTLRRMELEKKVEALLQEIAFLRNLHHQEMEELQQELQQAQVPVEIDVSKPDLTAALKEIRTQYEVLSARNQQSSEEWYKSKFANFTEEAARSSDSIRQAKEEISEYRRQLQARNIEIEALRSANESLERQLQEAEERGNSEIHGLQETISQLENALRTTKGEMARHLREYQDLLNVKMALDIEIAAYRKLLEGEETRLSNVGSSCSSSSSFLGFSYPFSSSPLSSLKGFSRSTVVTRKEDLEDNPKEAEEEDSGDEK